MALLVYHEPRKLCPTLPSSCPLPILPSHSSPFKHFCAILPISFTSYAFWSSGFVFSSGEPVQAAFSSIQSSPPWPSPQVELAGLKASGEVTGLTRVAEQKRSKSLATLAPNWKPAYNSLKSKNIFHVHSQTTCSLPYQNLFLGQVKTVLRLG